MLGVVLEFVYAMPYAAGYGPHWLLEDSERDNLSVALAKALNTLPAAKTKRALKFLGDVAPWLTLAATAGAVTMPRIQETQRAIQAYRSQAGTAPAPESPPGFVPESVGPDAPGRRDGGGGLKARVDELLSEDSGAGA